VIVRDVGDLAHDVGAHDPLPVDDAAKPTVPRSEHDTANIGFDLIAGAVAANDSVLHGRPQFGCPREI